MKFGDAYKMKSRFLLALALLLACSATEAQIIGGGIIGGGGGGPRDVTVIKSGTYLYVRTKWSDEYDLVQKNNLNETPTAFTNSPQFTFVNVGTIPVATADAAVPATAYTVQLHTSDDDITPIQINGTFIGANHGCSQARAITVTGHGKTVEDVGSEWTDGDGDKFYILRIVNANSLWVLSENKSVNTVWSWVTTITDNTLTHSSGATHTDAMTVTASATAILMPAIKHQVRSVLLNGVSPVTADGVYKCRWLDIRHDYDISDVPSLLAYVISQVGSSTQPSFTDESIDDCVTMEHVYRYSGNGACTVYQTITNHQVIQIQYFGGWQSGGLVVGGAVKAYTYLPGMSAITVGENTYDFTAIAETTTVPAQINFNKTNWLSATDPPDRLINYTGTAANAPGQFGWALGYHTQSGIGAIRDTTLYSAAGNIYTTHKTYGYACQAYSTLYSGLNTVPADTEAAIISYRCPINYGKNAFATNVSWYRVGSDIFLILDVHATVSDQAVALERELAGRTITVIDSHQLTIAESVVGVAGITIDTTDGYGWVLARLN
jgi:hypothetical protein